MLKLYEKISVLVVSMVLCMAFLFAFTAHAQSVKVYKPVNYDKIQDIYIQRNIDNIRDNTFAIDRNAVAVQNLQNLQVKVCGRLMLHETDKHKMEVYYQRTVRGGSGDEAGFSFTFNLGKTYAEKQAIIARREADNLKYEIIQLKQFLLEK